MGLWLPEMLREPGTSTYAQGVEVSTTKPELLDVAGTCESGASGGWGDQRMNAELMDEATAIVSRVDQRRDAHGIQQKIDDERADIGGSRFGTPKEIWYDEYDGEQQGERSKEKTSLLGEFLMVLKDGIDLR